MHNLTIIFKALANERRIKILATLNKVNSLPVNMISNRLKLSIKSTSKHLLLLERAGFLQSQQQSSWVLYAINTKAGKTQQMLLKLIAHNY